MGGSENLGGESLWEIRIGLFTTEARLDELRRSILNDTSLSAAPGTPEYTPWSMTSLPASVRDYPDVVRQVQVERGITVPGGDESAPG